MSSSPRAPGSTSSCASPLPSARPRLPAPLARFLSSSLSLLFPRSPSLTPPLPRAQPVPLRPPRLSLLGRRLPRLQRVPRARRRAGAGQVDRASPPAGRHGQVVDDRRQHGRHAHQGRRRVGPRAPPAHAQGARGRRDERHERRRERGRQGEAQGEEVSWRSSLAVRLSRCRSTGEQGRQGAMAPRSD